RHEPVSKARGPCKTITGYSSVGRPRHSKETDLQQADDSRCSVVNRDRNEDEFGFRGAEIVCYRPLCSGKASSSSCYTKSHVDTTSTCYLFCIIISDPSSQSSAILYDLISLLRDAFKQDDIGVSSHA